MRAFLGDINAGLIFGQPRLAALLYSHYRIVARGMIFFSLDDLRITYANQYYQKITGRSEKAHRKQPLTDHIYPDDRSVMLGALKDAEAGRPRIGFITRYLTPHETLINLKWTISMVGTKWCFAEAEIYHG